LSKSLYDFEYLAGLLAKKEVEEGIG